MHSLFYRESGEGRPVVLLHGFLENHHIWSEFANGLSKHFRVIAFDLPGFGKSKLLPGPFSISDVAACVLDNLREITSEPVCMIGHSLGGYVTLAVAEQNPECLNSFVLFHSTAMADTPEKKEARTKTIDFVKRNGALAFTSNFVQPLFANATHPTIPAVTSIAIQTQEQTVVSYLSAMRDRPARTHVLENFTGSVLLLAGLADMVIPYESLEKQVKLAKNGILKVLPDVAHMGMFEAFEETLKTVSAFAASETQTLPFS